MEIRALASGSKGNCYSVDDGQTKLLIECGISFRQIQTRLDFEISKVKACLISHEHKDHSLAVGDLVRWGIDCYASQGTIEALVGVDHARFHPLRNGLSVKVGTWVVTSFPVKHDATEPLGLVLRSWHESVRLLYLTDTPYSEYRFPGLTHIMVECNYALDIIKDKVAAGQTERAVKRRVIQNHMSLEAVKNLLIANDLSRVQEIWLLHLSDENSDADRFRREVQEISGSVVKVA